MKAYLLELISQKKPVFSGQVTSLSVPTQNGEITILPGHASLITPLVMGEVRYTLLNENVVIYTIGSGMLEVSKDKVVVLLQDVVPVEQISLQKAQEAMTKAQELLKQRKLEGKKLVEVKNSFRRSLIDLKIAKKYRRRRNQPRPTAQI